MYINITKNHLMIGGISGSIGAVGVLAASQISKYRGPELTPLTSSEIDSVMSQDDDFALDTYKCMNRFFRDAPKPKGHEVIDADVEREDIESIKKQLTTKPYQVPDPEKAAYPDSCMMAHLQQEDKKILFRSETVIKTDSVAAAVWIGLKSNDITAANASIKYIYHLALYERDGKDGPWSPKVGYSGRGSSAITDNKNVLEIDYPFSKEIRMGPTAKPKKESHTFFGVWEESKGNSPASPPIFISSVPGQFGDESGKFRVMSAKGYREVRTFYYEPKNSSGSGKWKTLKGITLNKEAVDTVEAWFMHFRAGNDSKAQPASGVGTPLSKFCKGSGGRRDYLQYDLC